MGRQGLGGLVFACSVVAAVVFGGVAVHELNYASDHPHAYGPAKVIAWAACAGALVSVAVAVVGWTMITSENRR